MVTCSTGSDSLGAMASNSALEYLETVPDEVVIRILSHVPGRDRINLQLIPNKRIRGLAVTMITDSRSFQCLKTEYDFMMLLGYSNLRTFHFPIAFKSATEEWFVSFGRKLSLSCPLIEKFIVQNDAIQIPYYYMINLDEKTENRVASLEMTISEKMEEIPIAVMIVSVIERSKKLSHISLTCRVKVCREAMDVVIEALKKKCIRAMHVSFSSEMVYFLQQVQNFEKLSLFDFNEVDNSYLNKVMEQNSRLKFLHVVRYGIFNSFRSLTTLNHLETLIIDLRNPFGLRLNTKEMIESIPSSIKVLMIAFNCLTSAQSLTMLPAQVPAVEKLYFCSRFPRAYRTPNRFREIIDIFTQMTSLKELFVSLEVIEDGLEEIIRSRLPNLNKLVMMTRGRDEWTRCTEQVSHWNNMS